MNKDFVHKITLCQLNPRSGGLSVSELDELIKISGLKRTRKNNYLRTKFDKCLTLTLNNVSDYINSLKNSNIYNLVNSVERGDYDDFIDSNIKKFQREEVNNLKKQLSDNADKIKDEERKLKHTMKKVSKKLNERNNTDIVDRVNLISKSKSKKISSIKAKQNEYLEEMNKLNYSKNKLTKKENQLERSVKLIEEQKNVINELKNRLDSIKETDIKLVNQLEGFKSSEKLLLEKINELREIEKSLKKEIKYLQEDMNKKQSSNEENRTLTSINQINDLKSQLTKIKELNTELTDANKKLKEDINSREKVVNSLEKKDSINEKDKVKLMEKANEYDKIIEEKKSLEKQFQKSLNIQNNMNKRIQKLEVVKQRNTENLQELDELNKLLSSNDKKENKKNKELSKNKENIFNLQRKLNYQNEELQKLYKQNQDIVNQTKRFTNLIKDKDRQVEKIKEELDAKNDTLEQLQDRVRNMKLESASKDYNIDSLKKDVNENEKEIENMKYKNDLLIKEVDSVKSEYEKVSLENKKLENDIKLLLGDVKEYQNLVGDLKDAKVYVESRKSLEKDLENLQNNISSSNEFIEDMENEIDKLIDDSSLLKRKYMNEELNKLDKKQSREYFKKKVSNLSDQYEKYRKQLNDHEIDKQKYTEKLSKYDNEISDLLSNADIIVGNVNSNVKIGKMREYITNSKKIQEQMKLAEVKKNENNKKLRSVLNKMNKISILLDDIREVDAKEKNLERLSELSSKMQVLEENFMKNEEDIDVSSMFQKVLSDEKDQETSCKNITSKEDCKPPCSYIWLDDLRACVTKTAESEKLSNAIRFKILQRKKEQQGGSNIDDDNDLLVQKVSSLQDEIILKTKDLSERRKLYLEEIERLRKESEKQKSENDLSIRKFEKQNEIDTKKLSELEADKLKLQSQLDEAVKKIDSINAEIADINFSETGSLSIKKEEKKGFFNNLFGKDNNINKSKLRDSVKKLVEIENENKKLKDKLESRLSQKSQLNNSITKINEILNSENNTTENIQIMKKQQNMGKEQLQMLEIENKSLQKDLERSSNDINILLRKISDMGISSSQLNELKELVDSKENFYSALGDDSSESNDSGDIGKQNTSTKISKLIARVKILEKQKDELETKLDTKNKEANQLESNVENAKTFITESKTKEMMQTTSIEELQRMLKQKEEENITLTNNINQLQEKLGESSGDKTEIRDLTDKAKNNKELVDKYQKNIEELNAKILSMTETNLKKGSKQELELEKMNLQLKEFTNKQKEAQSKAEEYMKKLEESTDKLNKRNEEIVNLQNELKELEKSSEESDEQLKKQLEEKYNTIISDKEAKIKQNIDDFEAKEKELELKIKERETEINEKNKQEIEKLKEESKKSNEKLKEDIKGLEEKAQKDIQKEKEEFERKKEEILAKQKEIQENASKEIEKVKSERNDDKKKQTEMIADTQRKLEADKKNEIDKLNQKMEEEKRNFERKILEIEGGNKDAIEKERQRSEKIQKESEEKIRRNETEATQKINELNQKYQNQQQQLRSEIEKAKQASMGQLEQLKNQHQMQLQQITNQKDMEIQRLNQQVQGTIGMVQQAQREAQVQAMGQAQIIQDQFKASEERLKKQQLDSENTRREEKFQLEQDFNAREARLEQENIRKDNERQMAMQKMQDEHKAKQEALEKDQQEISKKMNDIDEEIKQKSERTRKITDAIENQMETRDIIESKVKARLEKENEYEMKLLNQQKDKLEKDKADLKAKIESLKDENEQERINLEKEYKEEKQRYMERYNKLEEQSKKQENLCGNRKINSLEDLVKSYKECGSRIKSIETALQSRIRDMENDMSSFGEEKDVQEFNKEDLKPDELLNLLKIQMEKDGIDASSLKELDDYDKYKSSQFGEEKAEENAKKNIKKLIELDTIIKDLEKKIKEIEKNKKNVQNLSIEEIKKLKDEYKISKIEDYSKDENDIKKFYQEKKLDNNDLLSLKNIIDNFKIERDQYADSKKKSIQDRKAEKTKNLAELQTKLNESDRTNKIEQTNLDNIKKIRTKLELNKFDFKTELDNIKNITIDKKEINFADEISNMFTYGKQISNIDNLSSYLKILKLNDSKNLNNALDTLLDTFDFNNKLDEVGILDILEVTEEQLKEYQEIICNIKLLTNINSSYKLVNEILKTNSNADNLFTNVNLGNDYDITNQNKDNVFKNLQKQGLKYSDNFLKDVNIWNNFKEKIRPVFEGTGTYKNFKEYDNIDNSKINCDDKPKDLSLLLTKNLGNFIKDPSKIKIANEIGLVGNDAASVNKNIIKFRTSFSKIKSYNDNIKKYLKQTTDFIKILEENKINKSYLSDTEKTQIKELKDEIENLEMKINSFENNQKKFIAEQQSQIDKEIDNIINKINLKSSLNSEKVNLENKSGYELQKKSAILEKENIMKLYLTPKSSDSIQQSVNEGTQTLPEGSSQIGGGRTAGDRIDDLLSKFQNTYKRYQSHVNDVVDDSRKGEEIVERIQQYAESSANQIKYLTNLNLTHQMADRNLVLYMLGRRQDKNNNVKYVNEYNILLQTAQKEKALNELDSSKKEENVLSSIKEAFKNKINKFDLSDIIGEKNNVNIATYDDETGEDVPLGNDKEEQDNLDILEKLESQINNIMKMITTEDVRSAIDYLADRRVDELNSEQFAQLVIKMNHIEKEKEQLKKEQENWEKFRKLISEEAGTDDVNAIIEVYKDVKKKLTDKNAQLQNRTDELNATLKHISEKVKNDSNLLRNMKQDLGSQLEYMVQLEQEGLNKNKNVEEAMEHQQVAIEQIKRKLDKRIGELNRKLADKVKEEEVSPGASETVSGGSNPLGLIQYSSKKLYKSNKNYGKYLVNLMRKNITRNDVNKTINLYNKYVNKGNFLKKEYSSQQEDYHRIIDNVLEVQENPHIYFVGGSTSNKVNNKSNKHNSVSKNLSLLLSRLNSSADRFLNSLEKKNTNSTNTENSKYERYLASYNKLRKEMEKNKDTSMLKYYQSRLQKIQNKLMKYSKKDETKGGSKVPKAFNPQNLDQFVSQWQDNTNSSWQQYLNEPKVVENMTLGKFNHLNKVSLNSKELDTSNFSVNFI